VAERAVSDFNGAGLSVGDSAPANLGSVKTEGAVDDVDDASEAVMNTAAGVGGVAGERAVENIQRTAVVVEDAAAIAGTAVSV